MLTILLAIAQPLPRIQIVAKLPIANIRRISNAGDALGSTPVGPDQIYYHKGKTTPLRIPPGFKQWDPFPTLSADGATIAGSLLNIKTKREVAVIIHPLKEKLPHPLFISGVNETARVAAISRDGSTYVGSIGIEPQRAFRSRNGHLDELHVRNGAAPYSSGATCVSSDGTTVAGSIVTQDAIKNMAKTGYPRPEPFIWTQATGIVVIKGCPDAASVSDLTADGRTAIINVYQHGPMMWTSKTGLHPFLKKQESRFQADQISPDGEVVLSSNALWIRSHGLVSATDIAKRISPSSPFPKGYFCCMSPDGKLYCFVYSTMEGSKAALVKLSWS